MVDGTFEVCDLNAYLCSTEGLGPTWVTHHTNVTTVNGPYSGLGWLSRPRANLRPCRSPLLVLPCAFCRATHLRAVGLTCIHLRPAGRPVAIFSPIIFDCAACPLAQPVVCPSFHIMRRRQVTVPTIVPTVMVLLLAAAETRGRKIRP